MGIPNLLTKRQFLYKHKAFTRGSIDWWIFNANSNGLAESGAIIRINRKLLINEEKFFDWVQAHAIGGGEAA